MNCTTIDLLRHGHCDGGEIFRGHWDSALSAKGFEQMQKAIENSDGWLNIYCSPSQRCLNFAKLTAETRNLSQCTASDNFREISFGDWEGRLVADVIKENPVGVENFWADPQSYPPPNGETIESFNERVVAQWGSLVSEHKNQHTLLISHGGVIRCILAHVLGMGLRPLSRLSVPHACISRIQIFHEAGKPDWPQLISHQPLLDK